MKPDVIRAWERRYGAIEPARTETNRRYYTDAQIERLLLLRKATLAGRQIGQIAGLAEEELRELLLEDRKAMARVPGGNEGASTWDGKAQFASCLAAIESLDTQGLTFQLDRAAMALAPPRLIDELLVPLLEQLGDLWERGKLRIAHEHLASAVIRTFLAQMQMSSAPSDSSPHIVVATPMRQQHEIGALIAAATAASEGWRVTYLGADLPAEELAVAVVQKNARVIALSIVYPVDDPHLEREMSRLRRLLGAEREMIFGGRAAGGYSRMISKISATRLEDMNSFRAALRELRN